ncbi:XrtA system polysaccharide deacetylase [Candidatus Zixiibacteriota bacterium]
MKCIFTIDVEDWFHILGANQTPSIRQWDTLPSRVEANFRRLLAIFDEKGIRTTCFFLGWIAEKYPHLVKEALDAGHDLAAHGYGHRLAYEMDEREFRADAAKSKKIIEDLAGRPVNGFRAPGFSVTASTPWFFAALAEAGFAYDSSVFPATRGHGGYPTDRLGPHWVGNGAQGIVEFPISVTKLWGKRMCFFGGGYLRAFPYYLIKKKATEVLADNRPVIFYIHPREIDLSQPRLPLSPRRRLKSYLNLKSTEIKLRNLLTDFEWMTIAEYLNEYQDQLEAD